MATSETSQEADLAQRRLKFSVVWCFLPNRASDAKDSVLQTPHFSKEFLSLHSHEEGQLDAMFVFQFRAHANMFQKCWHSHFVQLNGG